MHHLVTIVPAMKVTLIHGKHLRAKLQLIVQDSTPPQVIWRTAAFLLARHIHQLYGIVLIILVTLFLTLFLILLRLFSLFFSLNLCQVLALKTKTFTYGPHAVLPDRVALRICHDLLDKHHEFFLDNLELALKCGEFPLALSKKVV